MRVLEVTRFGFFKALQPDSTCWIRWGTPLTVDEPHRPDGFGFPTLAKMLWCVRNDTYDLVVLPAIHPEHRFDEPWHKLAAKSVLQTATRSAVFSALLSRIVGSCRHVIVDIGDDRHFCEATVRLFPRSILYFKRELDLDRIAERSRVRPLPLFVPNETLIPKRQQKDIDVFFAGALCNEIRSNAVETVRGLSGRDLRVVIPPAPLAYPDFMVALARSWLVLSPEGYGWDCYRHYEACLAGSVPVINRPSYRRPIFLRHGEHCFYYDPGRGSLAEMLHAVLANKDMLMRVAEAGRQHVLANHTRSAVARYILREIVGETAFAGKKVETA
ncbi:MAG TPA: glycosyltransferase [Steroidobacteraceae bacterium]|nr:glycosyltransferase [Steroidobacteraceae bacterium]